MLLYEKSKHHFLIAYKTGVLNSVSSIPPLSLPIFVMLFNIMQYYKFLTSINFLASIFFQMDLSLCGSVCAHVNVSIW